MAPAVRRRICYPIGAHSGRRAQQFAPPPRHRYALRTPQLPGACHAALLVQGRTTALRRGTQGALIKKITLLPGTGRVQTCGWYPSLSRLEAHIVDGNLGASVATMTMPFPFPFP